MTHSISLLEVEAAEGMTVEEIAEDCILGSRVGVPATCSEYCEVEPDGRCPHGHPSILIVMGVI